MLLIIRFIIAQHKDLKDEEVKVQEHLQNLIDVEERKFDGPSLAVQRIKLRLFQPNESAEFPHVRNGTAIIPHIIHQIADSERIPDNFFLSMRSFVKYNPTWEYRFWTYNSGYNFLVKYHPYLADLYDSFGEGDVKKSDLLRLAVLYEYGGLYADLDVTNLRSLNITTTKYACIIPTEAFEHAAIIYREAFMLTTSVMLCRPKHPFLERVLLHLQLADPRGHPVGTTGPAYLTKMFKLYANYSVFDATNELNNTRTNAPYFSKGTIDEEGIDGIYIPNSQYFADSVDPEQITNNGSLKDCLVNGPLEKADEFLQRACKEFESRRVVRKEKKYTFTLHHWFHLWTKGQDYKEMLQYYNIKEVIPKVILFEESQTNGTSTM